MVRTRLQARQHNIPVAGDTSADSSDAEVSFNPAWLDHAFLGRGRTLADLHSDDTTADTIRAMAEDRQERRIQLLESAAMGMTEKFDELLSSIKPSDSYSAGRHDTPGGPPRSPQRAPATGGRHYAEARPPTHVDYGGPQYAGFIAEQLRREEFAIPRHDEGKGLASDMFIKELLPKPYMYLDRPGANTIKKKLDLRETMTFNEYVVAYLKMIRDPRVDLHGMVDHHLEHLQQVTEDAATRDWPSVRRWSNAMFDAVEGGSIQWEDKNTVQIQRMRYALLAARQPNSAQYTNVDRRDIPCRDFNAYIGCAHPKSHQGRNVYFTHVCSVCFVAGDKSPHPAYLCPRKSIQQQQPPQGTIRYQAPPAAPASKNGQLASQQMPRAVRPTMTDFIQ